jgi:hypothetical protein
VNEVVEVEKWEYKRVAARFNWPIEVKDSAGGKRRIPGVALLKLGPDGTMSYVEPLPEDRFWDNFTQEGWELISASTVGSEGSLFFKRCLQG